MSAVSPSSLEKALQTWLAGALGLTIDTNLFRGSIQPAIDNAACVRLETPIKQNDPVQMDTWNVQVLGKFTTRDAAMAFIANVNRLVPTGGFDVSADSKSIRLDTIIPRGDGSVYEDTPDGGKLKHMATVNLIVMAR